MKIKEISHPNSSLKIEVIELSESEQKTLTTNVDYIREKYSVMQNSEPNKQEKAYVDPYLTLGKLSIKLPLLAYALGTRTSNIRESNCEGNTAIHINTFELPSRFIQLSMWSNEPEILFFLVEGYDSPIETVEIKTRNSGYIVKFLDFFKNQYENLQKEHKS